jgi:CheY-like chemotaxis protein
MPESRHVLIVDDDEEVRQLFSDIITLLGFNPAAVGSGVAALQHLKATPVDLVILDMKIPDMNGLEIFKAIRQFDSSVPIVLTSGFGMDKDVQEGLSLGALLCLEKPFEVTRTMQTLRDIVEKESPRR